MKHGPCSKCNSSDACYDYGTHMYCFSCSTRFSTDKDTGKSVTKKVEHTDILQAGHCEAIKSRKLSQETTEKFDYRTGYKCHIANFYSPGGRKILFQKIRKPGKKFSIRGKYEPVFYGQHLWSKGKKLVITEGELDCLSMSQVQGNQWPVVSLPNGASAAKDVFMAQLDWLEGFDEIILMFDMDEPGQEAVESVVDIVTPGKIKIAKLPLKDASEMLKAGRGDELIKAMWNASAYRPDGIVAGEDLWQAVCDNVKLDSTPYPWVGLNNLTHGMRKGELVLWTAGTGVGKTQILRETAHHLIKRGERVGILSLEEAVRKTALGIMSIEANQPLHLEEHDESFLRPFFHNTVGNGRVFLYDHFGSLDTETLLSRIRYMAKANGCDWVILDHLSIVVSGLGDGDERRLIDNMMTKLRSFVEETGIGLHLVSHLKRPRENDKGHEEGARVTLAHLRGSQSIAQLSDMIIALERNKQSKSKANETTVRVLKNRFSGDEGVACKLSYNTTTGRLHEVAPSELTPVNQGDDNGDF